MAGKFKKRKNKKAKEALTWRLKDVFLRTVRTIGLLMTAALAFYVGTVVYEELLTSPYLEVKTITVEGAGRVPKQKIVELSGIAMGQNIWSLDPGEAQKRVISHPFVKEAKVKRRLPDRINIVIREREPAAFVMADGLYVMDRSGELFKTYSTEDALDLPVVTAATQLTTGDGGDGDEGEGGEGVEGGEYRLKPEFLPGLLGLISALKRDDTFRLEDISEIHVDPVHGFSLYTLDEGVRIYMGNGGFEAKLSRLKKVLQARGGSLSSIETIDLTGERGVVVRFTAGEAKNPRKT